MSRSGRHLDVMEAPPPLHDNEAVCEKGRGFRCMAVATVLTILTHPCFKSHLPKNANSANRGEGRELRGHPV